MLMHKYIELNSNVEGDGNCGYQVVSTLLYKRDEDHTFVCHQLIKELKAYKESYTRLYKKKYFGEIHESLITCISDLTPKKKWMRFSEMGHIIGSAYNRVCIDLTRYKFFGEKNYTADCPTSKSN